MKGFHAECVLHFVTRKSLRHWFPAVQYTIHKVEDAHYVWPGVGYIKETTTPTDCKGLFNDSGPKNQSQMLCFITCHTLAK